MIGKVLNGKGNDAGQTAAVDYRIAVREFSEDGAAEVRVAERFCRDGKLLDYRPGLDENIDVMRTEVLACMEALETNCSWRKTDASFVFPGLTLKHPAMAEFLDSLSRCGVRTDVGTIRIV